MSIKTNFTCDIFIQHLTKTKNGLNCNYKNWHMFPKLQNYNYQFDDELRRK